MTFPDAFIPVKNDLAQLWPFIVLIEIQSPTGGPLDFGGGESGIVRLAAARERVHWGVNSQAQPVEWRPANVALRDIQTTSEGDLSPLGLSIGSAFYTHAGILERNDWLRQHFLFLHIVHSQQLSDPTKKRTDRLRIASATLRPMQIDLDMGSADLNFDVPAEEIGPTCSNTYRGDGCWFSGDPGNAELGACSLTLSACRRRGVWQAENGQAVTMPGNFGGTP